MLATETRQPSSTTLPYIMALEYDVTEVTEVTQVKRTEWVPAATSPAGEVAEILVEVDAYYRGDHGVRDPAPREAGWVLCGGVADENGIREWLQQEEDEALLRTGEDERAAMLRLPATLLGSAVTEPVVAT